MEDIILYALSTLFFNACSVWIALEKAVCISSLSFMDTDIFDIPLLLFSLSLLISSSISLMLLNILSKLFDNSIKSFVTFSASIACFWAPSTIKLLISIRFWESRDDSLAVCFTTLERFVISSIEVRKSLITLVNSSKR